MYSCIYKQIFQSKEKNINEADCNYSLISIERLISNGEGKDDVLRVFLKEDETFPT